MWEPFVARVGRWTKRNTDGLVGILGASRRCLRLVAWGVRPRAKRAPLPNGGEQFGDAFQSCTVVLIERIELFGIDVEDATDL